MTWNATRVDESRVLLRRAADWTLSMYVEQEGKKDDHWRDVEFGALIAHIEHEFKEVRQNIKRGERGYMLHNAGDVASMALMFVARAMELNGMMTPEQALGGEA